MNIIVASKNPIKIESVKKGLSLYLSTLTMLGVSIPSGVSDQPMSSDETFLGAKNRAENALKHSPEGDMRVGAEGGVEDTENGLSCFAWIYIIGTSGTIGYAKSGTFFLPPEIRKLVVEDGFELGDADDIYFGTDNSKQGLGGIGLLSKGVMTREDLYAHAVSLAYLPFIK